MMAGMGSELPGYRASFPARWMAFVRAHFQDATHVQFFFSVDEKTARNWWEGKVGPQGWVVGKAVDEIPSALEWLRAA